MLFFLNCSNHANFPAVTSFQINIILRIYSEVNNFNPSVINTLSRHFLITNKRDPGGRLRSGKTKANHSTATRNKTPSAALDQKNPRSKGRKGNW